MRKLKRNIQQRRIKHQLAEINILRRDIEKLTADNTHNEIIIKNLKSDVDAIEKEWTDCISDARKIQKEYRELIQEVQTMKSIVVDEVFGNGFTYRLVKLLMKNK